MLISPIFSRSLSTKFPEKMYPWILTLSNMSKWIFLSPAALKSVDDLHGWYLSLGTQRISSGSWRLAQPHCNPKFFCFGNISVIQSVSLTLTSHNILCMSAALSPVCHKSSHKFFASLQKPHHHLSEPKPHNHANGYNTVWMNYYIQIMVVPISHSTYPHAGDGYESFEKLFK